MTSELRSEDIEFKAGQRTLSSDEVMISEIELLEHIRITQTLEELDTLTVTSDLVRDPEKFMLMCTTVGGPNFLRIPPSFEDKGSMFSTGLPLWLEAKKFNSLPKWILMYLERSIWVHYSSTISCKFPPDCVKSLWLQHESKLINFKHEILPFWADFCQKLKAQPDIVLKLYQDLEAAARQQIEV